MGQPEHALPVPHVVGVAERLGGVPGGQLAAELVDEEEPGHEQQLTDERWARGRVRPRFYRLAAGIHPPAPSLTVVRVAHRVRGV
ncbi:hypothetical protein GCM10010330_56360 [Streptomyces tendae]|nr:hypothetical protein GCM10010330_56360 [Streptomyces tendae]